MLTPEREAELRQMWFRAGPRDDIGITNDLEMAYLCGFSAGCTAVFPRLLSWLKRNRIPWKSGPNRRVVRVP